MASIYYGICSVSPPAHSCQMKDLVILCHVLFEPKAVTCGPACILICRLTLVFVHLGLGVPIYAWQRSLSLHKQTCMSNLEMFIWCLHNLQITWVRKSFSRHLHFIAIPIDDNDKMIHISSRCRCYTVTYYSYILWYIRSHENIQNL